ncbi:MAG: HEAT repeat domain-containing protein [Deltaproteobacteria bacterium]|nr:HEAT repeat domain-containing protein [Deltaproteobacteria bacterium]
METEKTTKPEKKNLTKTIGERANEGFLNAARGVASIGQRLSKGLGDSKAKDEPRKPRSAKTTTNGKKKPRKVPASKAKTKAAKPAPKAAKPAPKASNPKLKSNKPKSRRSKTGEKIKSAKVAKPGNAREEETGRQRAQTKEVTKMSNEPRKLIGQLSVQLKAAAVKVDEMVGNDSTVKQATAPRVDDAKRSGKKPESTEKPRFTTEIDRLLRGNTALSRVQSTMLNAAVNDFWFGQLEARQAALRTMLRMDGFAEPFFVALAKEGRHPVAEIALEGLHRISSVQLVPCIQYVFDSPEFELRLTALRAVQCLSDEVARPLLTEAMKDRSIAVRRRALSYLSWRDSSWALALVREGSFDEEVSVKWASFIALDARNPQAAKESLELMEGTLSPAYGERARGILVRREKKKKKQSTVKSAPRKKVTTPKSPRKRKLSPKVKTKRGGNKNG